MSASCGCRVEMVPNKYGNPIEDRHPEIVYCPLHASAARMLETLEKIATRTHLAECAYDPAHCMCYVKIAEKALAAVKG